MFVCLGNICRSPLAEAVFREHVRKAGLEDRFEIRSTGTGDWHVGNPADRRMHATAKAHGVSLDKHCAAQFKTSDLERYDLILAMDKDNLHDILYLDRNERFGHKVRLYREFDPSPDCYQVPDPYYGGTDGFEQVYQIVDRTARNLLQGLVKEFRLAAQKPV